MKESAHAFSNGLHKGKDTVYIIRNSLKVLSSEMDPAEIRLIW